MRILISLWLVFHSFTLLLAQVDTDSIQKMEEVVIKAQRIDIPFSQKSNTVQIISASQIQQMTAESTEEIFQLLTGVDVRRRGVNGMQSDLYIRGGSFEQTTLLIDGINTADPQTGHHTMNAILPMSTIERIEIIKGPSARIYGQNAFNGAINIVTKAEVSDQLNLSLNAGSFTQLGAEVFAAKNFKKSSHQLQYSNNSSDGYRYNTDFKNHNAYLKSSFETKNKPITVMTSFADRKFGASNFYTNSPDYNEYEETQTALVGVSTKYVLGNVTLKPKLSWRRNQDMFRLKRDDPSFSQNDNVSNNFTVSLNSSIKCDWGVSGFGVEASRISLISNNLGDQDRTSFSSFFEHRFSLFDNKLDVAPGVSLNYFSDFDWHVFPGLDVGYKLNEKSKLYWNIGTSYRIPTYTELYIHIPNFLSGNSGLKPEIANSQELGYIYKNKSFKFSTALFYREAKDLIDYVKEYEDSPMYVGENLREINTYGFEVNTNYTFNMAEFQQVINLSYTFMEDDYKETDVFATRYLVNTSIKNQFVANLNTQFLEGITQHISYRFVERPTNNYHIVDAKVALQMKRFSLSVFANNIFDATYFEYDNVPMPGANFALNLSHRF